MIKKVLGLLSLGIMLHSAASAQIFTIDADTVTETTTGTDPDLSDRNSAGTVDLHTFITNTSDDARPMYWKRVSDSTSHPDGWELLGVCDNIMCREPRAPWYYGAVQKSFELDPNNIPASGLLEARVAAPIAAPDGVGIFKLEVWMTDLVDSTDVLQSDTVTFIVIKEASSISKIAMNDQRVGLFPNPALDQVQVYTDRGLHIRKVAVLNMLGREIVAVPVAQDKELTNINLKSLAAGMYMVHLTDADGNLVTSRKMVKN
jgi:hypothetical protein